MKVTITIDLPDELSRHDLAWALRDVASRFARGTMTDVENVYDPYHDDIGTVVIT